MGANTFFTYHEGIDPDTAFTAALDNAHHVYGHRGYTGSLAEKDSFTVIAAFPMPESAAQALAEGLIKQGDQRIDDKWGPAGAIAVAGGIRTVQVALPPTTHGWADLREAVQAALDLDEGTAIEGYPTGTYETDDRTGRVISGTATVRISGGDQHTGWLFFGKSPH